MPTDIKLDQGGGNWVVVEGTVLKTTAADFMLDSPGRRAGHGGALRRALVHNTSDGLTINHDGDYRGGTTVHGNLAVTGDLKVGDESVRSTIAAYQAALQQLSMQVKALIDIVGAVIIPPWISQTEVEEGDDMGLVHPPAHELGLVVEYEVDQANPDYSHGDVISIRPPAGTPVLRGSTVVVRINLEG